MTQAVPADVLQRSAAARRHAAQLRKRLMLARYRACELCLTIEAGALQRDVSGYLAEVARASRGA